MNIANIALYYSYRFLYNMYLYILLLLKHFWNYSNKYYFMRNEADIKLIDCLEKFFVNFEIFNLCESIFITYLHKNTFIFKCSLCVSYTRVVVVKNSIKLPIRC